MKGLLNRRCKYINFVFGQNIEKHTIVFISKFIDTKTKISFNILSVSDSILKFNAVISAHGTLLETSENFYIENYSLKTILHDTNKINKNDFS